MGRLTKDPEIRYTQSAEPVAVARFGLAVDRNFQKGDNKVTDFFEIEAWRQKAEFADRNLKKGQLIAVEGSFQQFHWEEKDGKKRYTYRLVVENFYFAEGKKTDREQNNQAQSRKNNGSQSAGAAPDGFDPFADDDMAFYIN
jgi:single-strand DNA-binding protein